MSHIVESCPLTKLNGGLSLLRSADEDAVLWNGGWPVMVHNTHTRRRRLHVLTSWTTWHSRFPVNLSNEFWNLMCHFTKHRLLKAILTIFLTGWVVWNYGWLAIAIGDALVKCLHEEPLVIFGHRHVWADICHVRLQRWRSGQATGNIPQYNRLALCESSIRTVCVWCCQMHDWY